MSTRRREAPVSARQFRRSRDVLAETLPRLLGGEPLSREESFVREMMDTAAKLLRDGASLGDIKLLNGALRELRYAVKTFAPYRHVRKVAAFGSARTRPDTPAYRAAEEFGRRMAAEDFMLITGAGGGIMEAYQGGSGRERSFGVNIRLPFEQQPNPHIRNDPKLVTFRYFFTRKVIFLKEADAVVLMPGGFGTHDEGFESLTLVQTGKSKPMPIVFLDHPRGRYWKTWKRYVEDHLLRAGLISEEDMDLFSVTNSVDHAVEEITRFYRVYHSSRHVGEEFVIRLAHLLPETLLAELNHDFSRICVTGGFRQCDALPEERRQEPHLNELPRLVFRFNRTNFGQLRRLIDRINRDG